MGRPSLFTVHKPFFGTSTEVHAAVQGHTAEAPPRGAGDAPSTSGSSSSLAAGGVSSSGASSSAASSSSGGGRGGTAVVNGRHPGYVPGRAVLDVPGWQDSLLARSALGAPQQFVSSRLRIFSGTSNPVSARAQLRAYHTCARHE
jgi:hypothetical protein